MVKSLVVLAAGKAMDAAARPCPIAPEDSATATLRSTSNPAIDPGCRSWVSLTRSAACFNNSTSQ
jgi:hypothetical protein